MHFAYRKISCRPPEGREGGVFPSRVGKAADAHDVANALTGSNMEEAANDQSPKARGKGGRPRKSEQEKAAYRVGTFSLTHSEKQEYDKLFFQSELTNETRFFSVRSCLAVL